MKFEELLAMGPVKAINLIVKMTEEERQEILQKFEESKVIFLGELKKIRKETE